MSRHLPTSCNKTSFTNYIINKNNLGGLSAMTMPGSYVSSPMPSSGQVRRDSLEEEAQRTFSPWTGKLVFAPARSGSRDGDVMIGRRSGDDEPSEVSRSGSSSGRTSFSDQENEVQHIKTLNRINNQKSGQPETPLDDSHTGSSLLIDRIIDLTLSPSPTRIPNRDDRMITIPLRPRPRAVARYASPECKTAMSPLKSRIGGLTQPTVTNKTLHPFFNPAAFKPSSPSNSLPPPSSHLPRLSMRTLQPGSQSTESATSGSQASTSTYTSTSTSTSTASPESHRRSVQVLRGSQNSRVVIEERIITGQRAYRTWGARDQVEEVPDDLVLDFDALTLGRDAIKPVSEPAAPKPTIIKSTDSERSRTEPTEPKRPVNYPFFDTEGLPFFTYQSLRPKPTLVYTCCPDETDDLLMLLQGDVVGFDMEWPVSYRAQKGVSGARKLTDKTALVQVCDDKLVLLLHLSKMRSFPQGLKDLINSEKIYKVGVNIRGDARKITQDFPYIKPRSMLDLGFLARVVDPENCGDGKGLISLARLTRGYLEHDLNKDNGVRKSDWSLALTPEQQEYAANDVVVSMSLYRKLLELAQDRTVRVDRDDICRPPDPAPAATTRPPSTYWARRSSWNRK